MTIDPTLNILWRENAPASEYEAWRARTFNTRRPDAQPLAIVKPKTVEHIVAATELAQKHDVPLAVRSGGHSLQCWTLRPDSILIDLEHFRHLELNDSTKEVSVSPSVTSAELLEFLAPSGLFFPVGHSGEVGLGGFLLQGGIGLNARVSTSHYVAIQNHSDVFDSNRAWDMPASIWPLSMSSLSRVTLSTARRTKTKICTGQRGVLGQVRLTLFFSSSCL